MTDYVAYAERNMVSPFDPAADPDRHALWQRLVAADSDAFVAGDWAAIEGDFDAENFEGVRCGHSTDPADWRIAFPTLASYRDSWLEQSRQFVARRFVGLTHRQGIYARTHLTRIDLAGDRALCHKQFFGDLPLADGTLLTGRRQTLYRAHRRRGVWKVVGFLGQLPLRDDPDGRSA
ncbi:MAG TPA: hypothetical protein VGF55_22505 [Gemmataceae bacterium]|jgi:hypothetical protein